MNFDVTAGGGWPLAGEQLADMKSNGIIEISGGGGGSAAIDFFKKSLLSKKPNGNKFL